MDPPSPLPPLPTAAPPPQPTTATTTAAAATSIPLTYPDSGDSSPRSRTADLPPPPPPSDDNCLPSKLRLMCSFGGHIIPRPHDKTLCYVGGETRIVVVDRNSSLAELSSRISKTLLNGRPFTLKYQLPNEDLDSLISVTTDEDLENMIEEYDRVRAGNPVGKPVRIRLFLFFVRPESVVSMGALLGDAKSEDWFVDALNSVNELPRGLSDSAAIDNLLNLDGVGVNLGEGAGTGKKLEGQGQGELEGNEKQLEKNMSEVHSIPTSPMVENSSSFGSSSSTPKMANLPPIRTRIEDDNNNNGGGVGVRVADQKERGAVEEQFVQMSVGVNVSKQQDEGVRVGVVSSALSGQPVVVAAGNVAAGAVPSGIGVSSEYVNRVLSDDERSDQGMQVGIRRPPLPVQLGQPRAGVTYNMPFSPDSVASDGSIASASSFSRQVFYQDQAAAAAALRDNRSPASPTLNTDPSVPSSQVHVQQVQVQVPRYVMQPQAEQQQQQQQPQQQQQQPQQQFVHAGTHYIAHPPSGQVPIPSYYQVYTHPPSQQQIHHPIDQQYPVYVMPMMQPPPYNMSMQSNIADATTPVVAVNRTMASPNPNIATSSAAFKDGVPPRYVATAPSAAIPDMSSSVYKTAMTSTPQMVQIPSSQYQPQFVGYTQMHHPSQSISVASSAGGNYGYEYASSGHDQGYHIQHPTTGFPAQYQTMTAASAIELSDASKQMPAEQQTRTSQP